MAGVALMLGGLIVYDSQLLFDPERRDSFLSFSVESPYGAKIARMLLVPGSSQEEAEWLARAKKDPDPRLRLNSSDTGRDESPSYINSDGVRNTQQTVLRTR
jgi:hypothetical protein